MMPQMQAHPIQNDNGSLAKAIGISVAAHLIVLSFFVLRMVIYPSEPLTLDNAIRVDIVALPDKSPQIPNMPVVETKIPPPSPPVPEPLPETPPVEAAKPEPVKPVAIAKPDNQKINLNKTKKAQDDALKRLAALEKIEHMTKSQSPAKTAPAPRPIKGNEISKGGSLSGVIRLEQQGYLESIHSSVQSRWNLPGFLASANLSARVRLYVDGQGNILKRQITQSSHNDIFDARLLAAIDASTPLPPPPKSLVGILEVDGIELGFEP